MAAVPSDAEPVSERVQRRWAWRLAPFAVWAVPALAALVVWRLVPDASDDDPEHIALVGPFDVGRVPYWVALLLAALLAIASLLSVWRLTVARPQVRGEIWGLLAVIGVLGGSLGYAWRALTLLVGGGGSFEAGLAMFYVPIAIGFIVYNGRRVLRLLYGLDQPPAQFDTIE